MDELIGYVKQNVFNVRTKGNLFNQYNQINLNYDGDNADLIRQHNLIQYIEQLSKPIKIMFIGIAPGYNGCRFSGVPFTSERILLGMKKSNFFLHQNYSQSSKEHPYTEVSATKIWTSFSRYIPQNELKHIFMWNIVPFHPYKQNKPLTNRDPEKQELEQYEKITLDIIDILQPEKICCFGNIPQDRLINSYNNITYAKHPSRASYETLKLVYDELLRSH